MSTKWYEEVAANAKLTQGDLIAGCPLYRWVGASANAIKLEGIRADVVVITQACDLEHGKVTIVTLCAHISLSDYQEQWKAAVSRHSTPSRKAWAKQWDDLKKGLTPSHSIIGPHDESKMEHRIVAFDEIFTMPRPLLETNLYQQGEPRLRLLPPYREHLSQAFARYFMRVGLPIPLPNDPPTEFLS